MNSVARPSFWRAYAALDPRVRVAARQAYQLFSRNPDHPSLRFKKLRGCKVHPAFAWIATDLTFHDWILKACLWRPQAMFVNFQWLTIRLPVKRSRALLGSNPTRNSRADGAPQARAPASES